MRVLHFCKCSLGTYYAQSRYIGKNLLVVTQPGSKKVEICKKKKFSGQWNIIVSINFLPAYNKEILGNIY